MGEYLIRSTTLTAIADAIRGKTGKTDPIPVPDMPAEIAGITTGGGGSSEDVRYVTFMSHDGSVEYGKKAVTVGDDCADPIARGVFDTPTRESTAQYDYTFAGWATEVDGGLNSDALKSVTEDRTVYANFIAAVRYYTITYYDGETVLKTESLAYGANPVYIPEKSGYSFTVWEPALATVTGDASYYAQWEEAITFGFSTWEDIARVCEEGKASEYFGLGNERTITITLTDGTAIDVVFMVYGINHDNMEDGTKTGLSIVSKTALHTGIVGYGDHNLKAGWSGSSMRSAVASVYDMLPDNLKPHIKPVVKLSGGPVSSGRALEETVDKIWVPSITEYGYNYAYATDGQGSVYEHPALFNTIGMYPIANGQEKTGVTVQKEYSTRSNNTRSNTYVTTINISGQADYTGGNQYVRIGFCI